MYLLLLLKEFDQSVNWSLKDLERQGPTEALDKNGITNEMTAFVKRKPDRLHKKIDPAI
jgi:hypothetical protein